MVDFLPHPSWPLLVPRPSRHGGPTLSLSGTGQHLRVTQALPWSRPSSKVTTSCLSPRGLPPKKGTHTKYSAVMRYGTAPGAADFDDRRVVHAVLEGYAPDGSGRMCNGWKSEKAPWARKEHSTLDFYLQKQDLPAGWQAPLSPLVSSHGIFCS